MDKIDCNVRPYVYEMQGVTKVFDCLFVDFYSINDDAFTVREQGAYLRNKGSETNGRLKNPDGISIYIYVFDCVEYNTLRGVNAPESLASSICCSFKNVWI